MPLERPEKPDEYHPCKTCGAIHGMGIEDMETGEMTPIHICETCLFSTNGEVPIQEKIEILAVNEEKSKEAENSAK